MKFHYKASGPDGRIVENETEAANQSEVLQAIVSSGLRPVSIKVVQEGIKLHIFEQSISLADKIFLTKYLSLMLKVGTNLFQAIDILIADIEKPVVKSFLNEVRDNLRKGQPFYTAFAKHPTAFSPVFVNLIKAGEASGSLEQVFEKLSTSLEEENELRNEIRAALIYPVMLVSLSIIILLFLVTFALPKIANIFLSSGVKPPLFSQIVFTVGLFVGNYLIQILIIIGALSFFVWFFGTKTVAGRKLSSRLFHRLPIISNTLKLISLQGFASTFSSLLRAGLPILDALEITADAIGDEELRSSLMRISREGLAKGLTLGDAFRREPVFPKTVVNLIAISEKAGHLDEILDTLAKFYRAEVSSSVKTLVSFIEPMMLLFIGVVIGGIALSIIVPIYQLTTQF